MELGGDVGPPRGPPGQRLHPHLFYNTRKLKWRSNFLRAEEISPATFTLYAPGKKVGIIDFFFFSLEAVNSSVLEARLRGIAEKMQKDEAWEPGELFLSASGFFPHMRVYVTHTFAWTPTGSA